MRSNHRRASVVVLLWALLACGTRTPAAAATVEPGKPLSAVLPAGQFVEWAIAAEGRADRVDRDRLIEQALQADPDFAPARWLAGQIRYAGQWMTVDAALKKGADDRLVQQYRLFRAGYGEHSRGAVEAGARGVSSIIWRPRPGRMPRRCLPHERAIPKC